MANRKITGTDVLFDVGGNPIVGETTCSIGGSGGEVDMSNKSTQYWREYLPGRADMTASGSAQLIYDDATDQLETSQKALWEAFRLRSLITVTIAITANLSFSGEAFLTSFEGQFDDEDPAGFTWAVRFTGAVALNEGEGEGEGEGE